MSKVSMLEAVKIQARAIIPVVKALEAEIGREKAHALVGRAIGESWAEVVAARTPQRNQHPGEAETPFAFPVESEVVAQDEQTFGRNFTACAFADYFREIGEPEIGALLTCGVDFAVEKRIRPDWEFRRTQTRMQGAPFCDFRAFADGGASSATGRDGTALGDDVRSEAAGATRRRPRRFTTVGRMRSSTTSP